MIYQSIHNLILSVIKWEKFAATICPLTDSMLYIEDFSMSFRGTTEGIGGNAISLAAFCLSDETLTSRTVFNNNIRQHDWLALLQNF